jgi:serine---pyruvate transaminase
MNMKYRLMTPGPTPIPEAVLAELAKPITHHRTEGFRKTFAEVQTLLQYVFQTQSVVHTITGSGTAAYEAALGSCVKPGGRVLNVSNGKFAERWASMAKTFGMEVTELKLEYGRHVTAQQISAELDKQKYDAVSLVHSETSTATACDLAAIGAAVRKHGDTLLMVDGITSVGALPFRMDEWGVDVAITGSQKALMLPPGLGFVALSARARAAVAANTAVRNFYFDLKKYEKSIVDADTPFTPANTLIEALAVALRMIKAETIEVVNKRVALNASAYRAGVTALGLKVFSQSPSDSVTAVLYPSVNGAVITDKDFRGTLRKTFNVHVVGGQGSMEGTLFRVNHMGHTDPFEVLATLSAIELTLAKLGYGVDAGAGVLAAQKVIAGALA